MAQTLINWRRAGLEVKGITTSRGSVLIELPGHRIVDGDIVPTEPTN